MLDDTMNFQEWSEAHMVAEAICSTRRQQGASPKQVYSEFFISLPSGKIDWGDVAYAIAHTFRRLRNRLIV